MKPFDEEAFKLLSPIILETGHMTIEEQDGETYLVFSDKVEAFINEHQYDVESFCNYMLELIEKSIKRDNDISQEDW